MTRAAMRPAAVLLSTLALTLVACSGGGDVEGDDSPSTAGSGGSGGSGAPTTSTRLDPGAVLAPITAAMTSAGSVVVTRTLVDSAGGDGGERGEGLHEDIEVAFTDPVAARVLHVGEEIWTLNVTEGIGYLKDQSEVKSVSRWRELTAEQATTRLAPYTVEGLLSEVAAASAVTEARSDTVRSVKASCRAFTLPAAGARSAGSARLCVDGTKRPIHLVVTRGAQVTTSTFSAWGFDFAALAPPESLVDRPRP